MALEYEVVIGLEVHVELKTKAKMFCGCPNAFGGEPNSYTCPVCLGLPGALPVLNKEVLEFATRAALALNCEIARVSRFDRKNYFYPDIGKGYQISQFAVPLGSNGYIEIEVDGQQKRIGVRQLHMEEDAGKLVHQETTIGSEYALVDMNRAGVPLVEIVSEPDLRSAAEARAYLENLKAIMQYAGVSDCKMEEGSLRCDANISIRPLGSKEFGEKTEVKNMNSFRAVYQAIEIEVARQKEILAEGGQIEPVTLAWKDQGDMVPMRAKTENRYCEEPEMTPLIIEESWIKETKNNLPELPAAKKERFVNELGLSAYDAGVLTSSKELADYFEGCLNLYDRPKTVANWIMGEFLRLLNVHRMEIQEVRLEPEQVAELLKLIDEGTISGKIAKDLFEEMFKTGKSASRLVEEKGLTQISDEASLEKLIDEVIQENPGPVGDYRGGKKKALGFLVGQIMKKTKGRANPKLVNKILIKKL